MGKRIRIVDQARHLAEMVKIMGEVRVKIKFSNAAETWLALSGKLSSGKVRSYVADALVDTGAVRTIIPVSLVKRLGLEDFGTEVVELADGRRQSVSRVGPLLVEWEGRNTVEEALVLGDEVLIGQTVLEKLDLFVDCAGQRLVPNPAHPDQAVTKVKSCT